MPSFLNPRAQRRKQELERRQLQAKKDREARALAALAEELGWDDAARRESDVGTLGGSTLVGSIEHYEERQDSDSEHQHHHHHQQQQQLPQHQQHQQHQHQQQHQQQQRLSVDQLSIEQLAAARWRAHTPELPAGRPEVQQPDARPRSIRFTSGT